MTSCTSTPRVLELRGGRRLGRVLSARLWLALLPTAGCANSAPGADQPIESGAVDGDRSPRLDASGPPPRSDGTPDATRPPPTKRTTQEAGQATAQPDAARPVNASDREPCCAIDGGARPPSKTLEGCTSALIGEIAPPPPDVCAQDGNFAANSVSLSLARKLVAGHSYRFSYAHLQAISGGPVLVDIFGSEQPCVRSEPLFTLRLDGRPFQEYCFVPKRDVLYLVTRVEVGGVDFSVEFSDALVDVCAQTCTP